MKRIMHVAVLGARGYLGRELIRLLVEHPAVEHLAPASSSSAGDQLGASLPAFRHRDDLAMVPYDHASVRDADVVFMALGHGEAKTLMPTFDEAGTRLVVDLSRDHRLAGQQGADGWTYAMADLDPVSKGTSRIANPGCYPTASLLALAPALRGGLVAEGPIIVDGKSGVSGAGATPRPDLHYAETNESVRAYKVLGHDHLAEIRGHAAALDAGRKVRPVRFTPHLVPQNRGLLATAYAPTDADARTVTGAYRKAYRDKPFVEVVPEAATADVCRSNRAQVAVDVDEDAGLIVARGAIDNLVKGGSGQAVQHMNDALGLASATGLTAIGGGP